MKDALEEEIFSHMLNYGPIGRRNLSTITDFGERSIRNRINKLTAEGKVIKLDKHIGHDVSKNIRYRFDNALYSKNTFLVTNLIKDFSRSQSPLTIKIIRLFLRSLNINASAKEVYAIICLLKRKGIIRRDGALFELNNDIKGIRSHKYKEVVDDLLKGEYTKLSIDDFFLTDIPISINSESFPMNNLIFIPTNKIGKIASIGKSDRITNPVFPIDLNSKYGFTVAGALYGDGCFRLARIENEKRGNPYKRFVFEYSNTSMENVRNVMSAFNNIFGEFANFRIKAVLGTGKKYYNFSTKNGIVGNSLALAKFSIGDKTIANPKLPNFIMIGSKENKLYFLRQFFFDECYTYYKGRWGPYINYGLVVDIDNKINELLTPNMRKNLIKLIKNKGYITKINNDPKTIFLSFSKLPDNVQKICINNRSNIMKDTNIIFRDLEIDMKSNRNPSGIYLGVKSNRIKLVDASNCYNPKQVKDFIKQINAIKV